MILFGAWMFHKSELSSLEKINWMGLLKMKEYLQIWRKPDLSEGNLKNWKPQDAPPEK